MKVIFVLTYSTNTASQPLLWQLIKDFDVKLNILRAEIRPDQEGNMLVEFDCEQEERIRDAISWLESKDVTCVPVSRKLFWNEEACIDCGACTGVCLSGALSMDRQNWKLLLNRDICTACGLCTTACPMRCFRLDFGE